VGGEPQAASALCVAIENGGDATHKAMLDGFVGAWSAYDLDGIVASVTDDCVFWSSSGAPPQGGVSKTGSDSRSLRRQFPKLPDAAWPEVRTMLFGSGAQWERTFVGTADGRKMRVLCADIPELIEYRVRRKNSFRKTLAKS
jgi:hypothetical protein